MKRIALCLSFIIFHLSFITAHITLPALFTDGMVLQRNLPIVVWGWADSGEQVTVSLGRHSGAATADALGCWRVTLPAMKAGGPYVLKVGSRQITDVYVGDVWLCSGQSNVDTTVERVYPQYPDEIDNDSNALVRLFQVGNVADTHGPQRDVRSSGWMTLSRDHAWRFSALGYFLGKQLQQQTGVAQGVIQSSWGGTPIEAWLPEDSMLVYSPLGVATTHLYRDDQLVSDLRRADSRASERWQQLLDARDPGIAGRWTDPAMDDRHWRTASQWALPIAEEAFCGSYWLRQHVTVDAAHAGQPAQLLLGTLYDADITCVNGQEVGHTYYQYPPRRYQVPAGLLREGDNVIAVRFVNKEGRPRFTPEKPYCLQYSRADRQPLSERWLVCDGVQMPALPASGLNVHNLPSVLWNGMLCGLAPYRLAGVVWYQGESNTSRPHEYEALLGCLMRSWRQLFEQPDLPFAIVQLANFMAPTDEPQNSDWAQLRESQRRAVLADDRACLAVAIDLGEAVDIHPLLKKEVAARCVLCFDRLVYGRRVLLSPEVTAASVAGDVVTLTFDQPLRPGDVGGFELCGPDGRFRPVAAHAQGTTVTLQPFAGATAVRYAWKDNPTEATLRSFSGQLPAVPFVFHITATT